MSSVKPIPEGFHTITPSLIVRNGAEAIDFYKRALGAQERMRMPTPDGKVSHAELQIGDSIIFLSEEMPNMGGKSPQTVGTYTGGLYLYVQDVDSAFKKAVTAGGKTTMPVSDMFWGDRMGQFTDPYGHVWSISTHVKDLSEREVEEGAKKFYAQMAQQMAQKKTA
jgi:PhnB protein